MSTPFPHRLSADTLPQGTSSHRELSLPPCSVTSRVPSRSSAASAALDLTCARCELGPLCDGWKSLCRLDSDSTRRQADSLTYRSGEATVGPPNSSAKTRALVVFALGVDLTAGSDHCGPTHCLPAGDPEEALWVPRGLEPLCRAKTECGQDGPEICCDGLMRTHRCFALVERHGGKCCCVDPHRARVSWARKQIVSRVTIPFAKNSCYAIHRAMVAV